MLNDCEDGFGLGLPREAGWTELDFRIVSNAGVAVA